MTWLELPPLNTGVAAQLPELRQIALVAGPIGDHVGELLPEELPAIARARPKRAQEYSTGRLLARRAMAELGLETGAIPRAEDRSPVWPAHAIGSISHAGEIAIASVAPAGSVRGLGVDLEEAERVTEPLYGKLFTSSEIERLRGAEARVAGLMFSAKEAGYKAISPRVRRYVGFQEAEVDVDWAARTVRFRYVGHHEPSRLMEEGIGHFCFFEHYVLTVFIIP
jgi:4'-phosphopantetheinyl transferase EntD